MSGDTECFTRREWWNKKKIIKSRYVKNSVSSTHKTGDKLNSVSWRIWVTLFEIYMPFCKSYPLVIGIILLHCLFYQRVRLFSPWDFDCSFLLNLQISLLFLLIIWIKIFHLIMRLSIKCLRHWPPSLSFSICKSSPTTTVLMLAILVSFPLW